MSGPRFRPPDADPAPEALWVLARAFGPEDAAVPAEVEPERVLHTARTLCLSSRVAYRIAGGRLASELGAATARSLVNDMRCAAGATLALTALAERALECARSIDQPMVVLKGLAMVSGGHVATGCRWLKDADVLISERHAGAFHDRLRSAGFHDLPTGGSRHQLPALELEGLGHLDVHLFLPGVRLGGVEPARLEQVLDSGLSRPCALLTGAHESGPELLAAHAIAHGLRQHGEAQHAYPLLRTVADLVDLAAASGSLAETIEACRAYLGAELPAREVDGLRDLGLALAAGAPIESLPPDAALLLRHSLGGVFDARYRRRLRRARLWRAVRSGRWSKVRAYFAWQAWNRGGGR